MSVKPGSAIPTLKEELDRKVMDTLEWIQHAHAKARITDAQASVAVDTLFKIVSGLVDDQFIDIVSSMSIMYAGKPKLVRVLIKENKIVKMEWTIGESAITITGYTQGEETSVQVKEYDTPEEAKVAGDKVITKLKAFGYTQI